MICMSLLMSEYILSAFTIKQLSLYLLSAAPPKNTWWLQVLTLNSPVFLVTAAGIFASTMKAIIATTTLASTTTEEAFAISF